MRLLLSLLIFIFVQANTIYAKYDDKIYSKWKYLTSENTEPDLGVMLDFLKKYPDWPRTYNIRKKFESAMLKQETQNKIISYFADNPPLTYQGKKSYIEILYKLGKYSHAKQELEKLWHKTHLNNARQTEIYKNFGKYLTKKDHDIRLRFLLLHHRIKSANKLKPYLSKKSMASLNLRTKLIRLKKDAVTSYNNSPNYLKMDRDIIKDLVFYYRKTDQDKRAIDLIISSPTPTGVAEAKSWYTHRKVMARVAFKMKRPDLSYKILKNHGFQLGANFVEANWYMGWIQLRHLNNPNKALDHFTTAREKSFMPISRARGDYWIGRSLAELGKKQQSKEHYQKAGNHFFTYYGQLALTELGVKSVTIPSPPKILDVVKQIYNEKPIIKAAKTAYLNDERKDAKTLLLHMARRKNIDPQIYVLLAQTAKDMELYQASVKIGKIASSKGIFLKNASYPVLRFFAQYNETPHNPLYRALTRQESEYDIFAKSRAGARGLMQLMPKTAKQVSKKIGKRYNKSKLTEDPDYNVSLGVWYLDNLLGKFNGSYIKSLAAYNAGPSRVSNWVETYGKPEGNIYNLIDWVETIPFSETRNYVQRIIETVQIYRAQRKKNSIMNVRISKDLLMGHTK